MEIMWRGGEDAAPGTTWGDNTARDLGVQAQGSQDEQCMQVSIVAFPETRVAAISHVGSPSREHETARRLIAWKLERGLLDQARYRSYGLHYTDPRTIDPSAHRVDFCLSYDGPIEDNAHGIVEMTIPAMRCARARDIGSRLDNKAAQYLYDEWLPGSGEQIADRPLVFHYVNVGPGVKEHEAITDVYLPLR
jgi:AraC family transcriptional regulator